MKALNIEIKARCNHPDKIREILSAYDARFIGTDHQVDIYYKVPQGRLKLRQGNIENALIYYKRDNQEGPKQSDIKLYNTGKGNELDELLSHALGTLVVVDKTREIYFIDNVKFHIDEVRELGSFVEIEAIDEEGIRSSEDLQLQCEHYLKLFSINDADLIAESYSDLSLKLQCL